VVPTYSIDDGRDMRAQPLTGADVVADAHAFTLELIAQTCCRPVKWEAATAAPATHMVDFGPGGTAGVGALVARAKEGRGVQVIAASALVSANRAVLPRAACLDPRPGAVTFAPDWAVEFRPRVVRLADEGNRLWIDTPFSRLMGRPPLMVAGMTPTSVHAEFVAGAWQPDAP